MIGGTSNDYIVDNGRRGGCGILGSCIGVLLGPILIVCAVWLLYWNEGRAVKVDQGLNEGSSEVISIDCNHPDPNSLGKLVYVSGPATPNKALVDPVFNLHAKDLALTRQVSMYQWVEESDEEQRNGHSVTRYTYQQAWSQSAVYSPGFRFPAGHQNPPMPLKSAEFLASVHCGALKVAPDLLSKLPGGTTLPVPAGQPIRKGWRRWQSGFYKGADPSNPKIGDLKVIFTIVPEETISAVAANRSRVLSPYTSSNGTEIALIAPGVQTPQALFKTAHQRNATLTWILRAAGFVLMLIGFVLLTSPITAIAGLIPFVGTIVGGIDFVVSLGLAFVTSLITIGVGWAHARPLVGTLLIAAAVAVGFLLALRRIRRKTA